MSIKIALKASTSALIPRGAALIQSNAEQGELVGRSGLLPVQRWYLERPQPERSHFNQSLLLEIDKAVSFVQLRAAFGVLLGQHDALRFRYTDHPGRGCRSRNICR